MPYDEQLDNRIRAAVSDWQGVAAKKMFGGICHLICGNMFCGVYKKYLVLRLGEAGGNAALQQDHTLAFDITGKPMKGWVMVEPAGFTADEALLAWLSQARDFALTLPPK